MFSKKQYQEHDFWLSYTDLVTGFMIIFIVITLILYNNQGEKITIDSKYKELTEKFSTKFENIKEIEITDDATIRFVADKNEELFESEGYYPTPYFKDLLDEFIPEYIEEVKNIFNEKDSTLFMKEIRIEGHTDSRGKYLTNLGYSSGRAQKTQSYILKHPEFRKNSEKFKEYFQKNSIAVGYSESRLLDEQGVLISNSGREENMEKSRRVEFRILLEVKK